MVVFGAMAAVAAFFELTKGKGSSMENAPKDFWRFRTNYTLVYALMMGAIPWGRSLVLTAIACWYGRVRTKSTCCKWASTQSGTLGFRTLGKQALRRG